MESKQAPQPSVIRKKMKNPSCVNDDNSSIPLYLGASALFISVVTVVFFYREIRKMKKDIGDIKQIKNQIANVDSRFDIIDSSIEELSSMIGNIQIVKQNQRQRQRETPVPVVEEKPKNVSFSIPQANSEEEESDDEVEVESVEED